MFSAKPELTPLHESDIETALEIIEAHDEDDAEGAEESYARGLDNQFALRVGGDLVGVTGFTTEPQRVAWLSWHYVHPGHQGKGYGEFMLKSVVALLKKERIRKLFISTSDYRENPSAPLLYARAIALYERLGFLKEATHPDYFAKGESELVFAKRLGSTGSPPERTEEPPIRLEGAGLIDETDASFCIDWQWGRVGEFLTSSDLDSLAVSSLRGDADAVFIAFPSDILPFIEDKLLSAGFKREAQLKDYYADGVHEVRLRRNA